MIELYPLLMQPRFDPRPWGTHDLAPIYSRRFEEKIGESWLTGDDSKVGNGPLAGRPLSEVALHYQRQLVGDAAPYPDRFPLLAKFLFPHEKLSVQVHPDDEDARALGEPWGKTECWYVADARPGAKIGLGLKPGVTRKEFARAIHENRAEELLNWVKVSAGEMIYVAGGTVHTLGPGSIIVETQQQSDTTFRLYDYGRLRELHLEDGLRVIKEGAASGKVQAQPFRKLGQNGNRVEPLVASPYFAVEKFELHDAESFDLRDREKSSAEILVALRGSAVVESDGYPPVEFGKGDAVVVPASIREFRLRPRVETEFLKSWVPGDRVPPPKVF
jgi:mannose-6-phosphate isomerase